MSRIPNAEDLMKVIKFLRLMVIDYSYNIINIINQVNIY